MVEPGASSIFSKLAGVLEDRWIATARPDQLPPAGDWLTWLILAGRGWGKSRTGAEWVRSLAEGAITPRIALVGPTAADVRDTMVEGESGILATASDLCRPVYEPSKRRLTWPNGVQATLFSSEEPDRLRGPQHGAAWADELAAWRNLDEAWSMLQFGLRIGARPRTVITTTPKPVKLLKRLVARDGDGVVITRGSTRDNAANLAPAFLEQVTRQYAGTRLGRQELEAEILDDVEGALWRRDLIDDHRRDRVDKADLRRIVVAIDPAVSVSEGSDETGIVVAAIDGQGRGFVLEDLSGKYAPSEWASIAVEAYRRWEADRIVAESNQGGAMVESTIRVVAPSAPVTLVRASRGKVARAEPVSALYEQGRVHHVGSLQSLEDQLCSFEPGSSKSPDRLDALVWALTELMLDPDRFDPMKWIKAFA